MAGVIKQTLLILFNEQCSSYFIQELPWWLYNRTCHMLPLSRTVAPCSCRRTNRNNMCLLPVCRSRTSSSSRWTSSSTAIAQSNGLPRVPGQSWSSVNVNYCVRHNIVKVAYPSLLFRLSRSCYQWHILWWYIVFSNCWFWNLLCVCMVHVSPRQKSMIVDQAQDIDRETTQEEQLKWLGLKSWKSSRKTNQQEQLKHGAGWAV